MSVRYTTIRRCVACAKQISEWSMMYSSGICRHCGHDSESTICDTVNEIGHWVWDWRKLWRIFLGPPTRWVKKELITDAEATS